MFDYDSAAKELKELLAKSQTIVVVQGDNPDADSLGSSLGLESILGESGKDVYMYCGIDAPEHLKFLSGWDRISKDLPNRYDLAIVVDCGAWSLLGNYLKAGANKFPKEKLVIIDEHDLDHDIEARLDIHDRVAVASSEIVFRVCQTAGLKIPAEAANPLAAGILADTLGLTNRSLKDRPEVFEVMPDLVRAGYDPAALQEKRLERLKITPELLHYRGELMQRVEYFNGGKIASITIPHDELKEHSQEFNPTVILDETRMVEGVLVAIGFKQYMRDGKLIRVTGRIRCSNGCEIADKLAMAFGGGGHIYAAGFKVEADNINFDDLKNKVIAEATRLIDSK